MYGYILDLKKSERICCKKKHTVTTNNVRQRTPCSAIHRTTVRQRRVSTHNIVGIGVPDGYTQIIICGCEGASTLSAQCQHEYNASSVSKIIVAYKLAQCFCSNIVTGDAGVVLILGVSAQGLETIDDINRHSWVTLVNDTSLVS